MGSGRQFKIGNHSLVIVPGAIRFFKEVKTMVSHNSEIGMTYLGIAPEKPALLFKDPEKDAALSMANFLRLEIKKSSEVVEKQVKIGIGVSVSLPYLRVWLTGHPAHLRLDAYEGVSYLGIGGKDDGFAFIFDVKNPEMTVRTFAQIAKFLSLENKTRRGVELDFDGVVA